MSAPPSEVATNGRVHQRPTPGAADPVEMAIRANQRRRDEILGSAMSNIYAGLAALRAENEQLRAEVLRLGHLLEQRA